MKITKRAALLSIVAATSLIGCNRGAHEPDKNPDNPKLDAQEADTTSRRQTEQSRDRSAANWVDTQNSKTEERVARAERIEPAKAESTSQTEVAQPVLAQPSSQVGGEPRLTQTRPVQYNDQTEDQNSDRTPDQNQPAQKRGVIGRVGQGIANTPGAIKGVIFGVGSATGYYASELYHAWRPTDDTTGRRDALEAIHDGNTATRAAAPSELASLKDKIAQTAPNGERISSIVGSDSDTKRLLVSVLTEQNPEAVAGASERLVAEVFKVADDADAKVQQIQFSLRDLANGGAYDSASSARVSLLQTELDKRIASDDLQSSLKRTSVLVLTTAAGAAFGGYNGVERTAKALHAIPFRKIEDGVAKARSPRFWKRWTSKATAKVEDGAEVAVDAGNSVLGRVRRGFSAVGVAARRPFVRTNPKALAIADVRDLLNEAAKVDKTVDVDALIRQLDLKKTSKKAFATPAQVAKKTVAPAENTVENTAEAVVEQATQLSPHAEFTATAKPGLYVAVRNDVKIPRAKALENDEYRLLFQIARDPKLGLKGGTDAFYSAPLKDQVAYDLAETLKTVPAPKRELAVVDVATGETIQASEADAQKLAEAIVGKEGAADLSDAGTLVIEGAAPKLAATTETADTVVAEKIASGDDLKEVVDQTKAGLEKGKKKVLDKGAEYVDKTKSYAKRSVATVKGDQPFDPAKAALTGALVGVPAYMFSRSAYFQGRRIGEGYDALYLEDLIPADRLQKVVIQPDGATEPAQ